MCNFVPHLPEHFLLLQSVYLCNPVSQNTPQRRGSDPTPEYVIKKLISIQLA